MKNNIIYTAIIVLSTLLFSACADDFLEYDKYGDQSTGNFWKTESDVQLAINGLYDVFSNGNITGRGFMWYICASDDMVVGRDKTQSVNMKNFIDDGSNGYTAQNWPEMYKLIAKANAVLVNVPEMEISQDLKNQALGEAYFFRAWAYMWLAPRYGDSRAGLPIAEQGLKIEEMDVARTDNVSNTYLYLIEDFKKAADLLPFFDAYEDADFGRPHKTACWAYIAKAYLYNAEYDKSSYPKVVEFADKVIATNKHALEDNYEDVFKIENNWGKEYIWSFVSNTEVGAITPSVYLENKGWGKYNGWGYWHATEELYQAFEETDPRREATILKFGDEFQFFGETMKYWSTNNRTGMQFRKFMDPYKNADCINTTVNPDGDNPTTTLNMPLIRYAEVLLFKAEALIADGKNGDEPLNEVRQRAGLGKITGAVMNDLKHERRVELAGEWADRHYDLVRWHDAEAVYAQPLHGRIHENQSDPESSYTVQEVWPARNFDPVKHHVWPIPPQEIEKSKLLKQNAGY
ncbi:RagB/SusD family nutrient uptake outer membrane protein [Saccharicrinis aurantiacus]|uniref:RagB/SusD family nutrient uptake outer membrane protein n=1 Tax=Saccharicrinis aurantiacus TaxID=1849719 RepID=UPI00083904CE|nr:RagB/SusD family nutrient uptake outer membrane protein [Saccharicrinis aurantiacus]